MPNSYGQSISYLITPDAIGDYPEIVGPKTPGWFIGGVKIDNPTNNWWQIKETGDWVPPYTVNWSRDFRPTQSTITLLIGAAASLFPTATPTITVTLYEYLNGYDVTVGNDNGISAPLTVQGTVIITGPVTISGTVSISGTVTVTGSVSIIGDVNIGTVAGTVTITGAVTISSGTVNIGNTPSVTIASGTVNIGNTPSVNIASGSVSISGSVTVGTITAGNVNVNPGTFTLGGQGGASINVTGTAFQLSTSSVPTQIVMIKARSTNSGIVYVGTSAVTNTQPGAGSRSTTAGFQLDPGDVITFPATNLNAIYINGTSGDGVAYLYWT